ncbi:vancomycin permeability regulator SanA [Nocardiopsis mwathae]|uniref:Vancomycin permeability regulator SanA n=1 Tax=Nocardiopsis mwathae TaxID=1472723 RepID=A0A7W9YE28_9ACTN|nr:ElyC/SanA/YdcF family protein [Nocardiopsis mwathae]MBB6170470.1 vancomycin permeability regulator SanA [Nocardiopsis mwathae]
MRVEPGLWAAVAATGVVAALAPTAWTRLSTARRRFGPDDTATVPQRTVAIVPGAAVWPSGPCPLLARRLDLAARLFRAGRVRAILVSGDNRALSNFETDAMTDYLADTGIPRESIVADPHGYRTWDTCVRARTTYGVDGAVIVTQSFHLPRAVALCRAAGIDAVGVGDPTVGGRTRSVVRGYARELGANAKAVRDAVLRPAPLRADPPVDDLRSALS